MSVGSYCFSNQIRVIDYDKICTTNGKIVYSKEDSEEIFIYIQFHNTGYYYPLNKTDSDDIVTGSDLLIDIIDKSSIVNFDKIYYVNSDFLLEENYNKIKKFVGDDKKNIDINVVSYPFVHLIVFLSDHNVLKYKPKKFVKKYNFVFLSRVQKVIRTYFIKELCKFDSFKYSNLNVVVDADGKKIKDDYEKITDISIYNDDVILNFENNKKLKFLPESILRNSYYDDGVFDSRVVKKLNECEFNVHKNSDINDEVACIKNLPLEYEQSFFELVCESNLTHGLSMTEKTFKPIFYEKPFISIASKNYYRKLKELGFELYDEIFDYSFDDKNLEIRINSILDQVKNILSFDKNYCQKIINSISNKINHNKKTLLKYYEENKKYFDSDIFNPIEHLSVIQKYNVNFLELIMREKNDRYR
jgi:hypothetical protein